MEAYESRKVLVETAIRSLETENLKWVEDTPGEGVSIKLDKKQANQFLVAMEDDRANKLFQCGFDMDELTVFCLARDEMEAKAKYIESIQELMEDVEEPGWEDAVWVEDLSDRVLL